LARALIVGCGCRGRELGSELAGLGWQVRGTSRTEAGLEAIEAAGFHVSTVRENTAYRFVSDRAAGATSKYGVTSISLLAHRS